MIDFMYLIKCAFLVFKMILICELFAIILSCSFHIGAKLCFMEPVKDIEIGIGPELVKFSGEKITWHIRAIPILIFSGTEIWEGSFQGLSPVKKFFFSLSGAIGLSLFGMILFGVLSFFFLRMPVGNTIASRSRKDPWPINKGSAQETLSRK